MDKYLKDPETGRVYLRETLTNAVDPFSFQTDLKNLQDKLESTTAEIQAEIDAKQVESDEFFGKFPDIKKQVEKANEPVAAETVGEPAEKLEPEV